MCDNKLFDNDMLIWVVLFAIIIILHCCNDKC